MSVEDVEKTKKEESPWRDEQIARLTNNGKVTVVIVNRKEVNKFHRIRNDNCPICGDHWIALALSPTEIGTRVDVICMHCKWTKDITDYDSW